jgi:hypothetical protein
LLRTEVDSALLPLRDDLAEHAAFDGATLFWRDRRQTGEHFDTMADVATVQSPHTPTDERFQFYRANIKGRHVRLAGTALEATLREGTGAWRKSGMNPDHMTYGSPTPARVSESGVLQAAFTPSYGALPSTRTIESIWKKHDATFQEITREYQRLDESIESIGDTLELDPPTVPNAYVSGWDLSGSTRSAQTSYGVMRNYLVDVKDRFDHIAQPLDRSYDDTGDGSNVILWIPGHTKEIIQSFGTDTVLPFLREFQAAADDLARDYPDLAPSLRFAVGLGSVEKDYERYDTYTSDEFWNLGDKLKHHTRDTPVQFTDSARAALFSEQ